MEEASLQLDPLNKLLEDEPIIELGDRIRLVGGKYDGTIGKIVLRTESEIHLMPDGTTHHVEIFPITEDGFDETSGIEAVEILQKRKQPSLVNILQLSPSQLLETFTSEGNPGPTFTILSVDPAKDSIVVSNEDSQESILSFQFRGIPKDAPFVIVRGRQAPEKPTPLEGTNIDNDSDDREGPELETFDFLDKELEEIPAEGVELLIEIPSSERTFSEVTQKSEAYADLLSMNSEVMQKMESVQKASRILVELFFQLRSKITKTSAEGILQGFQSNSILTLIDLLQTKKLSLSRAIIDAKKILFYDDETSPITTEDKILFKFHPKFVEDSNTFLTNSPIVDTQKFIPFLNSYLSIYSSTWLPDSEFKQAFEHDEEVFRLKEPGDESIPGYPRDLPPDTKGYVSSDALSTVSMSLIRGLRTLKAKRRILQQGEEASILSYIVFPMKYANSLQTHRNESLAKDIQDGTMRNLQTMKKIVGSLGEITNIPSSDSAFLIGLETGNMGNIPLTQYLKLLNVRAEGYGDIWRIQMLLGMQDKEWTLDQQAVIQEKITQTQISISDLILKQRESLAELASRAASLEGIPMIPENAVLIQTISEEPFLKEIQDSFKEQMPSYQSSDLTQVALLLRFHPDFTIAKIAKQAVTLTKLRMNYEKEKYLTTVKNKYKYKQRVEFAGEPPVPIHCAHVKPLAMIRRVKDINQRLYLLAKFLSKFQGVKENNWVYCRLGKHPLLCVHELLQIYQFLRPGDVKSLNKEIQLNFGGGQFQGYYICRNCGQPISELEYDTHLEFTDDGVPMSGRSEIVDKDAIKEEDIEKILGTMGDQEDVVPFTDELSKQIFFLAKDVTDRLYISIDREDLIKVVQRTMGIIRQFPTEKAYMEMNKRNPDARASYFIKLNRLLVCALGIHILIVIQVHIPEYKIRKIKDGCQSMAGEPLEESGTQGIQCITQTLLSFVSGKELKDPWKLTAYDKLKTDQAMKEIEQQLQLLKKEVLKDPIVMQEITKKRIFLTETLGKEGKQGRPEEKIPLSFAPVPHEKDARDFVDKIIIPQGASKRDLAELWFRQGNHLAKTNKIPKPLSFSETSCCLSPLQNVNEFWRRGDIQQSLPEFEEQLGLVLPLRTSKTEPSMIPAKLYRPLPDAPEDNYYSLFLKVCHSGIKKGHAHEFGYTRSCIWCNLDLPKEAEILSSQQAVSTLESQGIEVTKETFEDLLNETHRVNSFQTGLLLEIPGQLDSWKQLSKIEPEPLENYYKTMEAVMTKITGLPPDAKKIEIANAIDEFAQLAEVCQSSVSTLLGKQYATLLVSFLNRGPETVIRFLQSYIVVPLSRFLQKASFTFTPSIPKKWGLGEEHSNDLKQMLISHTKYAREFDKTESSSFLESKMKTVIVQARNMINILNVMRPIQLPGGEDTFLFVLQFCLFSPLTNFVNPQVSPSITGGGAEERPESHIEFKSVFPALFISDMVQKFNQESFNLTPEKIRENIARTSEEEKVNIIKRMNAMKGVEKQIEKMHIKHGTGKYAVGGTKAIYQYDKDQYDIERETRKQMGHVDFPEFGNQPNAGQPAVDMLGYYRQEGHEEGYLGEKDVADANNFDED